ncbi:hypothetical protein VKT23_019609 [Stygiomarasmius scandens]|uniref:Uncharacterized protein n=1 Tax=Marasmiellus scandens TaxID=2682957 RepID=A0ABR1IKZ0_9AGAR
MFGTPGNYYYILDNLWVDGMVCLATWQGFINEIKDEWQKLILLDTILLNANVAFLAIQSIDENPQRSPGRIASYLKSASGSENLPKMLQIF